jgi:hypothetical protein
MKVPNWFSAVIIVGFLGFIAYVFFAAAQSNPAADKPESPSQRERRQYDQANEAFARAITNDVVGYHRTIDQTIIVGYRPLSNCWATATVEFVNRLGGIERTNLNWGFKASGRSVYIRQLTAEQFAEILKR